MRVGVLGGSFDPPHFGHLELARQLLINDIVDEIWLMPCFSHAFEKKISSAKNRFEMANLIKEERIKTSGFEIEKKEKSYTIDTMNSLVKKFPEDFFYWIMGSDQLFVFEKYKKWQEIIRNHNLIIYPREKDFQKICDFVDKLIGIVGTSQNIIILDPKEFKTDNTSSTEIREKIKRKENIEKLLPENVRKYISEKKLYI